MPKVVFYDMPAQERLPWIARLVERAWQREKRMLIHCGSDAEARELDEALWCADESSFIPHEIASEGAALADSDARIVISVSEQNPHDATILLAASPPSDAFAERFETVLEIVDRRDPAKLEASRSRYRSWRDRGVDVSYKK